MKKIEIDRRVASLVWLLVERAAPLPQNNTTAHLRAVDSVCDQLAPFVTVGKPSEHPITRAKAEPARTDGVPRDEWFLEYEHDEVTTFTLALEDAHFDMLTEMWKGPGGQMLRNTCRSDRWRREICFRLDAALGKAV